MCIIFIVNFFRAEFKITLMCMNTSISNQSLKVTDKPQFMNPRRGITITFHVLTASLLCMVNIGA